MLPNFIVNGVCKKKEEVPCNIGYACDACPYNKNKEIVAECYCCKKEKAGTWIFEHNKASYARFVCNDCNHLEPKVEMEKTNE